MDGPAHENSDSDSGDSWTLLENPTYDAAAVSNDKIKVDAPDNHDKDDDTDGISIISDSEPETPTFCNVSSSNSVFEEDHPTEPIDLHTTPVIDPPLSQNIQKTFKTETMKMDDAFLGDSSGKHKIYVHRRNKKISTVLNIIMLGSIITAAGVAFGHLWGARNECSTSTLPSVNKILSNLYKLQEENAYLRNKLKELTALNNLGHSQKHTLKHNKCKKVFEESLHNNNNIKQVTKCVDDKNINANNHNYDIPPFEKEFIDDLGKLKTVYLQNKSILDNEINQRIKRETAFLKKIDTLKYSQLNKIDEHKFEENIAFNAKGDFSHAREEKAPADTNIIDPTNVKERKISYADSLKSTVENKFIEIENKKPTEIKVKQANKKPKEDSVTVIETSVSDEDLKKDNRYIGQKHKKDRQKHDRQKSHKKQKRRNKYEQWEMKGGFMKDYDDLSILSSNENDFVPNVQNENLNSEIDIKVVTDTKTNKNARKELENPKLVKYTNFVKQAKGNKTGKTLNWYEERALLRNEARKRLEQELFGETSSNTAGWYFRRMRKREQCRAKADNSTHRKFAKQNMNFKMKH